MKEHNPYTPPESLVAGNDPANPKLLKQLLEAWPDDSKMLTKLKRTRLGCVIVLTAITIYVTLVLFDVFALTEFAIAVAVLGGIALGFTIHLDLAFRQWPTLRKYFDWERMQKDQDSSRDA